MVYVWLTLLVGAVVVEAATAQLVSIWFAAGSLVALIAAAFGAEIWLQSVLFAAVTVITLAFTRKFFKSKLQMVPAKTNADRYVGETGVVIAPIDNRIGEGQVKVLGNYWSARSVDDAPIPAGTDVIIQEIKGVKLIVKPLSSE